jgi:hypothetical protein
LQSAKIVCVTSSHRVYALRKYTEAAFAGALLIGDVPTERSSELFGRFVVEIKSGMSDKGIINLFNWWISHKTERIERATLGQALISQFTFANKFKAVLGGAILFRSKKFGHHSYQDALAAHDQWWSLSSMPTSNGAERNNIEQPPVHVPTPPVPPPPPVPPRTSSWWGMYVGWVGQHNIGDDALLDIFAALLFDANHLVSLSKHLGIEQCTKIKHGGTKQAPLFVALGGGSLIRTNYLDTVDSQLARFPNAIPLMFGSGWDDYNVVLNSTEAKALANMKARKGAAKNVETKTFYSKIKTIVSKNIRFWQRPWIGGVRGPMTHALLNQQLKMTPS